MFRDINIYIYICVLICISYLPSHWECRKTVEPITTGAQTYTGNLAWMVGGMVYLDDTQITGKNRSAIQYRWLTLLLLELFKDFNKPWKADPYWLTNICAYTCLYIYIYIYIHTHNTSDNIYWTGTTMFCYFSGLPSSDSQCVIRLAAMCSISFGSSWCSGGYRSSASESLDCYCSTGFFGCLFIVWWPQVSGSHDPRIIWGVNDPHGSPWFFVGVGFFQRVIVLSRTPTLILG